MSNDGTDAGTMRPPISLFLLCAILTGAGVTAVAYLPRSFALIAPLAAMVCINVITRSRQRSRPGNTRSQSRAAGQNGMGSLIFGIAFGVIFIACILVAWNIHGTGLEWVAWPLGVLTAVAVVVGYWLPAGAVFPTGVSAN